MGNCSCLERPKVMAWDGDDDNGGVKVKIRMTKGQLRRLLESAGHGGSTADEDVVAEVMSMGTVRVEVVAAAGHRRAAEGHHKPPPKLETIQEDDFDE